MIACVKTRGCGRKEEEQDKRVAVRHASVWPDRKSDLLAWYNQEADRPHILKYLHDYV